MLHIGFKPSIFLKKNIFPINQSSLESLKNNYIRVFGKTKFMLYLFIYLKIKNLKTFKYKF